MAKRTVSTTRKKSNESTLPLSTVLAAIFGDGETCATNLMLARLVDLQDSIATLRTKMPSLVVDVRIGYIEPHARRSHRKAA